MKLQISELKIEKDEEASGVNALKSQINANLDEFKPFIEKLKNSLPDV